MNESKIKKLELEILNLISLRNIYINIVVIIFGGLIGLLFTEFNKLKMVLSIFGLLLIILFLFVIFNCGIVIQNKLKELENL